MKTIDECFKMEKKGVEYAWLQFFDPTEQRRYTLYNNERIIVLEIAKTVECVCIDVN